MTPQQLREKVLAVAVAAVAAVAANRQRSDGI